MAAQALVLELSFVRIKSARANVAVVVPIVVVVLILVVGELCNLFLWVAFLGPEN